MQLYNKRYLKKKLLYNINMVLYICNKCDKNFNRKQCYDVHINRKFPCLYEEINDQKTDNNKIKEL